jgi:hypothetical protein
MPVSASPRRNDRIAGRRASTQASAIRAGSSSPGAKQQNSLPEGGFGVVRDLPGPQVDRMDEQDRRRTVDVEAVPGYQATDRPAQRGISQYRRH